MVSASFSGAARNGSLSVKLWRGERMCLVGMDVVEVAPAYDTSEITALAAATMVWEYLALNAVRAMR